MHRPESDQNLTMLARHLDASASSAQIAELLGRVCNEIDLSLNPILGQRGTAALFARSLQLSAKKCPWLNGEPKLAEGGGPVRGEVAAPVAFKPAALCALVALQSSPQAAEGACLFLQIFHELLVSLVGLALTERLLRTPWLTFLSGTAARDNTQ